MAEALQVGDQAAAAACAALHRNVGDAGPSCEMDADCVTGYRCDGATRIVVGVPVGLSGTRVYADVGNGCRALWQETNGEPGLQTTGDAPDALLVDVDCSQVAEAYDTLASSIASTCAQARHAMGDTKLPATGTSGDALGRDVTSPETGAAALGCEVDSIVEDGARQNGSVN